MPSLDMPAISQRITPRGFSRLVWSVAVCGIAVLLIGVGALQYRWNGQIKRSSELRVGADLESTIMKWHLNLYREFSTICIALQVGPDSGAGDTWRDYLGRYVDWRTAPGNSGFVENIYSNPDVIREIYVYETSRGAKGPLLRLDPNAHKVERSRKPPELKALLAFLKERSSDIGTALRAWEPSDERPGLDSDADPKADNLAHTEEAKAVSGWQFEESIPAIVHPITHYRRTNSAVDWLVIVLNRETIEGRIFPELAERYFANRNGLEYKIAVVAVGKAPRVLYSSDPGFGVSGPTESDSVMTIFGPPPESIEGSFWQVIKHRESLHGEEWHRFSAPVWFPVIRGISAYEPWVLFLKHRSAPLDASITNVWRANLFVGGLALLLLGASMFLVLVATHRERALAALQMDFVTSISHELRTPLAAILAAGQNLKDGFAADQSRYGSMITAQARQLIELVDQILSFASLKDGQQRHFLEPVQLPDVLAPIRKTTTPVLQQAGFEIEFCVPENLPPMLADQKELLRCLKNLIENAAKYSGNSRWIRISAELGQSASGKGEIRISVADHGFGIPASEMPHIFDPFYRGRHGIIAQIHGSGLGLSVVKQIVISMGGKVSVTSQVGVGSIFTLHLPQAEGEAMQNTGSQREAFSFQ
jgi:signal transduction histidine kinase